MNVNTNAQADIMVDNKEERQKYIDRVEVLDNVKKLFLIPQLDMMTIHQVADFYEVELKTISQCVLRNSDEIYSDGVVMKKPRDFGKIWKDTRCRFPEVSKTANSTTYQIADNVTIVIPNRGVRCFSKRAVLRIGMLLRDSKIAQEVRTQLLNVFEHTESENPKAITAEIENEKELLDNITLAYTTGDPVEILKATSAHAAYLKRRNKTLEESNSILSGKILEWKNSASANKVVRIMAQMLGWGYGRTWNEIYNELLYKHGICLRTRWTKGKKKSASFLSYLKDDELVCLYKTIAAMLQARYIYPAKVFSKAKINIKEF